MRVMASEARQSRLTRTPVGEGKRVALQGASISAQHVEAPAMERAMGMRLRWCDALSAGMTPPVEDSDDETGVLDRHHGVLPVELEEAEQTGSGRHPCAREDEVLVVSPHRLARIS